MPNKYVESVADSSMDRGLTPLTSTKKTRPRLIPRSFVFASISEGSMHLCDKCICTVRECGRVLV